jgi:large subunit ribosomal protein L10
MNREQKAAAIAEIADQIKQSEAVFAVDFRGISVPQAADVRTRLRDADATFRVVKNTLTERAADAAEADALKPLLEGPTALTFVRGDAALAAKAIATFNRETQLLTFKGGMMDGDVLDAEQIVAISRLPARDVLYGQLVGIVASPITGLARGLNALLSGVAIALGAVRDKMESGELPSAAAPPAAETPGSGESGSETETPDQDAEPPSEPAAPDEPAEGAEDSTDQTTDQADASAQAGGAEATGGTT